MNVRILTAPALGACILALSFATGVAQATGSKASDTTSATPAPGTTSTNTQAKTAMHKRSQHHAASHSSSNTQHKHMTSATTGSNPETAYRAALKSCVEGPATQRDSCLDGAIVRFGRS